MHKGLHWRKTPSKPARIALPCINRDETGLESARHFLSNYIKERPVEVYAVALGLLRESNKALPEKFAQGVEDIARSAARNALRNPPPEMWTTKMNINRNDYDQITSYHLQCSLRLVVFLTSKEVVEKTGSEWIWEGTKCKACAPIYKVPVLTLGVPKHPTAWWGIYWERVVASIGECPCEELIENDQFWNSTLQPLKEECQMCYETAVKNYPRFKKKVIQIITDIINSVSIHLSPHPPTKSLMFIQQVELKIIR